MYKLFFIWIFSALFIYANCQIPKIALVKPNGTTHLYTNLQSAYNASEDDDCLYLPGGYYNSLVINKKLKIYGAGSYSDSTNVTGTSGISSIVLQSGASGSHIEGLYINPNIVFQEQVENITIQRNILSEGLYLEDSVYNITINNNLIGGFQSGSQLLSIRTSSNNSNSNIVQSFINNNVILGNINYCSYSEFKNNLFMYSSQVNLGSFNQVNNSIFRGLTYAFSTIFNNNVNITLQQGLNNTYYNNIIEGFSEMFEDPGQSPYTFDFQNDYHIRSTSQCKNSGTDGTDRGIYGGTFPWVEGMVPSNPHIYYKNVSGQTNDNGHLQVHFRVRTTN